MQKVPNGHKILIVDDEELIREAISSPLTSAAMFATNVVGVMHAADP